MTLVVEDGSGLPEAEAYRSIEDIQEYAKKRGKSFLISDRPAAEASARRAATWLDARYRAKLPGARARGRSQGLEWPRRGAADLSGSEIAEDEIPAEWLDAFCEVAIRELAQPGVLSPDVVVGKVKKSVSVSGAVSVTYADGGDVVAAQRPVLTLVDDMLSGIFSMAVRKSGIKFIGRA